MGVYYYSIYQKAKAGGNNTVRDVLREEKKFLQLHIFQESIPLTRGFLFEN